MPLKDIYFIIKRRILEKRNIIFIVITIILSLALLICLEVYNIFGFQKTDNLKRNNRYKTIWVYKGQNTDNDYDKINSLKGIVYSKDINVASSLLVTTNINNKNYSLVISPLLDQNELTIVNGRNITNDEEAVCPRNFYLNPVSDQEEEYLDKKNLLKSKDIIGKTLKLTNDSKATSVKIVGTFDAFKVMESLETCYVSENVIKTLNTTPYSYTGRLVKVKDPQNLLKISKEIAALGFETHPDVYLAEPSFKHIPIFVSLITLIVSFSVLYNFLKKKLTYHLHSYGILKAAGYSNQDIFKIEFTENIILTSFCYLISLIIFLLIYFWAINTPFVFTNIIYFNEINYKIPILGLLIIYIILIILNYLNSKILMRKYIYNRHIFEVLEDK